MSTSAPTTVPTTPPTSTPTISTAPTSLPTYPPTLFPTVSPSFAPSTAYVNPKYENVNSQVAMIAGWLAVLIIILAWASYRLLDRMHTAEIKRDRRLLFVKRLQGEITYSQAQAQLREN